MWAKKLTHGDMHASAAARVVSPRATPCAGARQGARRRDGCGSAVGPWRAVPRSSSKYLGSAERGSLPARWATGGEAPPVSRAREDEREENDLGDIVPGAEAPSSGAYSGAEDGVSSGADAARALRDLPVPKLSNDDSYFLEKLGVTFRWGLRADSDLDELNSLFASVGFPRRDEGRLRRALVHSHDIVWVVVANKKNKSSGVFVGQCVGFARCTSDGAFNATIWDVVVCPKWQGCGLGRGMVERLTQRLIENDIQNVSLYAEPAVVGLYQKCGFEEDPGGTTGMAFRRARRRRGSASDGAGESNAPR